MKKQDQIPSPAYVLEEKKLIQNLALLQKVQKEADVQIILALKAYALWPTFPLIKQYLSGATASSLSEARLIFEEMNCKAHTYSPAYLPDEFEGILKRSSHITFNSLTQFEQYKQKVLEANEDVSMGLRVNPAYSVIETDLYNPASPKGRLGETALNFTELPLQLEGLHFHTLCESSSYDLENVLAAFEKQFSKYFHQLKWVNFGGGHLITRADYDVPHLIQLLKAFKAKYPHLQIIMEPGSATAWQTGYLRSTVLDIIENGGVKTAILDVSFTAHMPDTLEMPYRPEIRGAVPAEKGKYAYRMGGVSCLAGDYLEVYHFEKPLTVGVEIILEDMIHYTMVKTTMFNGVKHPAIVINKSDGQIEILRTFGYEDFKNRLA